MSELVGERANVFVIRTADGHIEPRPKTPLNKLKYTHNVDMSVGTTHTLSSQPYLQVEVLDGGYDVVVGTTPDEATKQFVSDETTQGRNLERGILAYYDTGSIATLTKEAFPEIRRHILTNCIEQLFPPSDIIVQDDGVIIEDIYKVTWDGRLKLNQVQSTSYRPTGRSSVKEVNSEPTFLEVSFNMDAMIHGEQATKIVRTVVDTQFNVDLTDDELETLTLIQFVLLRKEITDDPLFWNQTEKSVLKEQSIFG